MEHSDTINKQSLLYRLATVYGNLSKHLVIVDRCTYYSRVITGLFFAFCITVISSIVACAMIGLPAAHIAASIVAGHMLPAGYAEAGYVMWTLLLVVAVGVFIYCCYQMYRNNRYEEEREPSELVKMYRAYKEKTCTLLKVE